MASRRMIHRAIATSKKLSRISVKAALLYTWLIPFLDDYGCYHADSYILKRFIFPYRNDFSPKIIAKCVQELESEGLIRTYQVDGYMYLELLQFDKFQTLKKDRKMNAEVPPPPDGYSNWNPNGIQVDSKKVPKRKTQEEVEVEEEVAAAIYKESNWNPTDAEANQPEGRLTPLFRAWEQYTGHTLSPLDAQKLTSLADWVDKRIREAGLRDAGFLPGPEIVIEGIREMSKRKPPPAVPMRYLERMVTEEVEHAVESAD